MKADSLHQPDRAGSISREVPAPSPIDTLTADKTTPLVNVIIPVHNRPAAVCRAIKSVLAQTYQNFDIVVVDDGSTDTTAAAVSAIADQRIRLVRHQQNRGGSAARNTGIQAGSAQYVAFLDSDDEWFPSKLERQLAVFERAGDRLGLVYTGTERVYDDGTISRDVGRRHADLARSLLLENVVGETSLGMVRRRALEATGGFDESLPSCQDMDLWLRLCEQFEADVVPEPLVRIVKGNDGGRISANIPRTVWGRELFGRKHWDKLVRSGTLYLFLRESGWWQQRRVRDAREARRFYLESLRANALAPVTYILLLASYLPLSWLDCTAHSARRLSEVLRSASRTWSRHRPSGVHAATLQGAAYKDSAAS